MKSATAEAARTLSRHGARELDGADGCSVAYVRRMDEESSSGAARNRERARTGANERGAEQPPGSGREPGGRSDLVAWGLVNVVVGQFYQVYRDLRFGHLESVYANALAILLRERGLDVKREAPIEVVYHGQRVGFFRADLLVENTLIVEIKAGRAIAPEHMSQVINYLHSSNLEVGLLLNFGDQPRFKRVVFSNTRKCR